MDQLVFLGEIRGLRGPALIADIQRWLERVDLTKWAKSKIEELSKGMQQKVQLIGTVLHTPDLLILDEPFSGLDPINQELFRELLLDYRSKGKSVVLSTHGMELAERLCDHICLISGGRAVLDGELKAIKRRIGGNAFRLVADGDLGRLQEMPEVEQALVQDGVAKLLLRPEVQGAAVLRQLVEFLNVHEFRSEEPELEQIFLKVVNDAA
jgi:ABC-2 type transport system ATP-binding protein